jgi:hypothetical protein
MQKAPAARCMLHATLRAVLYLILTLLTLILIPAHGVIEFAIIATPSICACTLYVLRRLKG